MRLAGLRPEPVWVVFLALALLASLIGRPDIPIDETRYVSVAWEMWSGGDWLVLHRNGIPYHHKPPLLFWLIGLGWSIFGVNAWWPRAVSALCGLAVLLLTAAIARRLWPSDEAIARRSGWLLLSGTFWLLFGTAIVFDVLLSACALLALLAALRARAGERRGTWGLFALGLGLGILAKGPVALLLVLPPLLCLRWVDGRWPTGWGSGLFLGTLGAALLALAWAVPAALFGGEEFRQAIFWGQTAGRVAGSLAHRQPFWFYLAVLPVLLLPGILFLPAWKSWRSAWFRRGHDAGIRFCLAWLLPALLVFSLSGGKQAHYILPLLPAVALFTARAWPSGGAGRLEMLPLVIGMVLLGALFVLHPHWVTNTWLSPYAGSAWATGGILLIAFALVFLVVSFTRPSPECLPCWQALAGLLLVMVVQLALLRPLSPVFDMQPMAERIRALHDAGHPVAHAAAYNDQYHFYGRLQRPLIEIARPEVRNWLARHPDGRVVYYLKRADEVKALQPEFSQPYLEGAVVLLDQAAAGRLAASAP